MAFDVVSHSQKEDEADELLLEFILPGTPDEIRARYAALPRLAQTSDFGIFDHNIVILDTETTGFSFNHDELIQIAAARMENGEVVDKFVTFVNPGKPISNDIAYLTNIKDEDVAQAPSPSEALSELVDFVGDAKIVAHNIGFDQTFTTKHPAGYSLLENTWIDSLDLARIALPRMTSHRLVDLVRAFGGPPSTHRADDDVSSTCMLFRVLLAAVDSMPTPLVREIAKMANAQQWSTSVVFSYFAEKKADAETTVDTKKFSLKDIRRARLEKTTHNTSHKLNHKNENNIEHKSEGEPTTGNTAHAAVQNQPTEEQQTCDLIFPSKESIDHAFSQTGLVSTLYDEYETRYEQLSMAQAIRQAFATEDNLAVEAGTGVGKSMAYLIPAVLTAKANNITIGIATKTNALLDQLMCHELPLLADALEPQQHLTFAALKGFSHYPCLRNVERVVTEVAERVDTEKTNEESDEEVSRAPALAALLSYIEQTEYDDIDSLKIDYQALPRYLITTTSRNCLRKKCPFYGTACFVHGARFRAEAADVVVTNHSLLFCDLATKGDSSKGALLPAVHYWIIDEAHSAENEARKAFSLELSVDNLDSLALRVSADDTSRNVFVRAQRTVDSLQSDEDKTLFFTLLSRAREAGRLFNEAEKTFTSHIKDLLIFDSSKKSKGYEYVDLWINNEVRCSSTFQSLIEYGQALSERAEKLIAVAQELVGYLESIDGAGAAQQEIASVALDLKEMLYAIDTILLKEENTYVYAARICRREDKGDTKLEALLYNVGEIMNDKLYADTRSVIFTSATLAVDESFNSFEEALGLNQEPKSHCTNLLLDSSFDFDRNMTVYVVRDIPEPNETFYLGVLEKFLTQVHIAQRGSLLTLFTNRREMEKCFEEVSPKLQKENLRLVCQKWGVSTKGLRDDFLKDEHLSLFALKSFWEGFDAPGATLKGVIIPKLPFSKPGDPLSSERTARDDQAWWHYVLPAAVLEVKQAAGRLIRKADDHGILILADRRLITKSYGKVFLNSLPSKNIHFCTMSEIVNEIERNNRLSNKG